MASLLLVFWLISLVISDAYTQQNLDDDMEDLLQQIRRLSMENVGQFDGGFEAFELMARGDDGSDARSTPQISDDELTESDSDSVASGGAFETGDPTGEADTSNGGGLFDESLGAGELVSGGSFHDAVDGDAQDDTTVVVDELGAGYESQPIVDGTGSGGDKKSGASGGGFGDDGSSTVSKFEDDSALQDITGGLIIDSCPDKLALLQAQLARCIADGPELTGVAGGGSPFSEATGKIGDITGSIASGGRVDDKHDDELTDGITGGFKANELTDTEESLDDLGSGFYVDSCPDELAQLRAKLAKHEALINKLQIGGGELDTTVSGSGTLPKLGGGIDNDECKAELAKCIAGTLGAGSPFSDDTGKTGDIRVGEIASGGGFGDKDDDECDTKLVAAQEENKRLNAKLATYSSIGETRDGITGGFKTNELTNDEVQNDYLENLKQQERENQIAELRATAFSQSERLVATRRDLNNCRNQLQASQASNRNAGGWTIAPYVWTHNRIIKAGAGSSRPRILKDVMFRQ